MNAPQRRSGGSNSILFLAIGVLVGLALGLLIGWVIWPTSWSSALPRELGDQYKTDYVLTIAESYFSTNDIDVARDRLNTLAGPDQSAAALVDTILSDIRATASVDRQANVRLASLLNLSAGLAASPDPSSLADVPTEAAPTATMPPIADSDQGASSASTENGDGLFASPFTGPLGLLLLAVFMIAGGLFIAYRMVWSPRASQRDVFGRAPGASSSIPEEVLPPLTPSPIPPIPEPPIPAPESDGRADYIFDEGYSQNYPRRRPGEPLIDDPDLDTLTLPPVAPPDFEDDLPARDERLDTRSEIDPPARPSRPSEDRTSSVLGGLSGLTTGLTERISERFGEGTDRGQSRERPSTPRSDDVLFSPDQEGYFVAEFLAGDDFEVAHSINRGRDYLGEVGMAVSKLNSGQGAYDVSALEVWLFEKSQITTRTQHLLSPHLFQTGDWDQSRLEQGDPPPIQAEEGRVFHLRGKEADLHCRITKVAYRAVDPTQSAFQSLRLELVPEVK